MAERQCPACPTLQGSVYLEVLDDLPPEKLDAALGQRLPHSGATREMTNILR